MHALVAVIAVLLFGAAPTSGAEEQTRTDEGSFEAAVPCTMTCGAAYIDCLGCDPDGAVRGVLREAGHDAPVVLPRDLVEACNAPFPAGSFDVLDAPPWARSVELTLAPLGDWDIALCGFRGPTSAELRSDPSDTEARWRAEAWSVNNLGDGCGHEVVPELPVGCTESITAILGAYPYRFVAYNFLGEPTVPYTVRWG